MDKLVELRLNQGFNPKYRAVPGLAIKAKISLSFSLVELHSVIALVVQNDAS
jgi:hypothetical protein